MTALRAMLDRGRKRPYDARLERSVSDLIEGRLTPEDAVRRRVVEISTSAAVPVEPAVPIPTESEEDDEKVIVYPRDR